METLEKNDISRLPITIRVLGELTQKEISNFLQKFFDEIKIREGWKTKKTHTLAKLIKKYKYMLMLEGKIDVSEEKVKLPPKKEEKKPPPKGKKVKPII